MTQRGPDYQTKFSLEQKEFISNFGFSRLSIQDLNDKANKIFKNENHLLLFNGEIYNKVNLKERFLKETILKTDSDTEILFYLLINYGVDIIQHIEGIFSIAFYNIKDSIFYLIKDYTGTKPLYYTFNQEGLYFSSEAWFLYSLSKKKIDLDCLNFYFRFGFSLLDKTLIRDVKKIHPNSIFIFDLKNNKFSSKKILSNLSTSTNTLRKNGLLRKKIDQSIKKNLIGDRKIGVFLSGGIDSTIISLCTRKINKNIEAYSSIYENSIINKNDDINFTKKICKDFGIKLNLSLIDKNKIVNGDTLLKITSYFDEPIANLNMISSFEQSRMAKQNNLSVILTGDGADEIFGGYRKYQVLLISNYLKYFSLFNKKIKDYSSNNENIPYIFFSKNDDLALKKIFKNKIYENLFQVKNHLDNNNYENNSIRLNKFDFNNWLPEEHNLKLDRCTMANSIEGRVPFQDKTILEYFNPYKIHKKIKWNKNKLELRNSYTDLPKYVLNRKKKGWFLDDKQILKDFLKKNSYDLFSEDSKQDKFFNVEYLHKLSDPSSNIKFEKYQLITIIMFKLWYKNVLDT